MKFFSQSHFYDDPWSIVTLAFFLRYPNPYASHVLSCDVVSRSFSPSGTLLTTRLILKRGAMPRWFPKGIITRAESWVVEETEVDPFGRIVSCKTRNLDHVKIMQVEETVVFKSLPDGTTLQHTEARVRSGFGWGLTKRIEAHGLNKFKANMQRSREGVSLVLQLLRQSRLQPMAIGGPENSLIFPAVSSPPTVQFELSETTPRAQNSWSSRLKAWLRRD
ncbi:PRELI/MSF1 domain-containing protein [Mycena indigotica]|uniref:PRELI/MSF1 domain-containing protein n=1 Tax=Mycena indigotica TaxID=2126181 RepID=A0A8H6SYC2_9AGAR|nr:PRELI/MSF1 domain-containing protein [Mycena indigotica]KAF7306567.1 PRELI/MSF1 domain-containing protein [Mycena indigotica]